jgi:DNA segregation ATPase FtsK/SpoIIIE, S-DNA-T family
MDTPKQEAADADGEKSKSLLAQFGSYDHRLELASYKYPPLDLLEKQDGDAMDSEGAELDQNKERIVAILNTYGVPVEAIRATLGPTITLYEIIPSPGVRVAKIKSLENDIALSLSASGTRVTGPIPGRGTIGIEVPNPTPAVVSIRSLLATLKFQNTTMDLPVALGKTRDNEVFIADLAAMPHLLIAGATGQGKSVSMKAILVSLLYKKHPAELKLVLIDVSGLEFSPFRKIERHFLAKLPGAASGVVTNAKKAIDTLNALCIEIDQRYDLFRAAQVRNLKEYNRKFVSRQINEPEKYRYLPFIVVAIDEFADLMIPGKAMESPAARIAQLGRPAGIHLIISTQRPSINSITGIIKINFPCRLAFRVAAMTDSRTILDIAGAEQLNGCGDMLFSTGIEVIHLQGAFVSTEEEEKLTEYIGCQKGYPTALLLPEYYSEGEYNPATVFDPDNRDPMFEEAARLIVLHQQGSTSLIQRKLKLGYNRAGRLISQLEAAGIVGPFEGSKARDVLFADEYSLERYLEQLGFNDIASPSKSATSGSEDTPPVFSPPLATELSGKLQVSDIPVSKKRNRRWSTFLKFWK